MVDKPSSLPGPLVLTGVAEWAAVPVLDPYLPATPQRGRRPLALTAHGDS